MGMGGAQPMNVVSVEFDWDYRSMTARYDGSSRVSMVVDDAESHDEVVERAEQRARQEVCRRGSFSPTLVTIRRLRIDGGRFSRS
jgi:hypothetical protein